MGQLPPSGFKPGGRHEYLTKASRGEGASIKSRADQLKIFCDRLQTRLAELVEKGNPLSGELTEVGYTTCLALRLIPDRGQSRDIFRRFVQRLIVLIASKRGNDVWIRLFR
jgi:hypothetical protein